MRYEKNPLKALISMSNVVDKLGLVEVKLRALALGYFRRKESRLMLSVDIVRSLFAYWYACFPTVASSKIRGREQGEESQCDAKCQQNYVCTKAGGYLNMFGLVVSLYCSGMFEYKVLPCN